MKRSAGVALFLLSTALFIILGYLIYQPINAVPEISKTELYPGGLGSVSIRPFASFMLPSSNIEIEKKPYFYAGKALANQPWIKAPTITDARDGLGPLYNARSCLTCHDNGGRGRMQDKSYTGLAHHVLRLSIPGNNEILGVNPEPTYGSQLQSQSVALSFQLRNLENVSSLQTDQDIPVEGEVQVEWLTSIFTYPEGEQITLRKPNVTLLNPAYGPLHPEARTSLRNAPPIHGMGLLQLIAQKDINKLADPDDIDNNGVSGRINLSWDFETGKPSPGRFGLKANVANLRIQVASALHGDMGIVSSIFPNQPCSEAQLACRQAIHGTDVDGVEISESLLKLMVDFNMSMAVPKRRKPNHPLVLEGREHFYRANCEACHQPSFVTTDDPQYPHLSSQTIWPYSDLLLHDMGKGLADGRSDYLASGSEWRTAPLWGVGLSEAVNGSRNFLHDGRARSIEEAILWHSGEGEKAKQRFVELQQSERRALIAYVKSL